MTQTPNPLPRPDRRPGLALFAGGLLAGAGLLALVLTVTGTIKPVSDQAQASDSPAAAASVQGGALVTPPPIAAPDTLTSTNLAEGRSLGRADAPLEIEVWADYQCPYCAQFTTQIEPLLINTYVETGQARLTFRDLAFLGDESRWAAVAAQLAEEQDRFWPFHDYLFANQLGENVGSFAVERLQEIASRIGLDRAAFDTGLQLDVARQSFAEIRTAFEADAGALNIHSTPTLVVDGTVLEAHDWDGIRTAIDEALAAN
jgi:protein-disulfide isomerase